MHSTSGSSVRKRLLRLSAVQFDVLIYFPWDEQRQKFKGERVYFFGLD